MERLVSTALNSSLQLIPHRQNSNFMKKILTLGLRYAERPASTMQILGVLPYRFHALAEYVYCITEANFVPGIVVVYSIESGDVRDVFVQDGEAGGILFLFLSVAATTVTIWTGIVTGWAVFVEPDCPVVLQGYRA